MKVVCAGAGPTREFSLHFDEGEEAISSLHSFAKAEKIANATVAGIGALMQASLARYNPETRALEAIELPAEQVEVLSMIGQITNTATEPDVHIHVVLGRADGSTRGGHLVAAVVRPMLLLTITELSEPITPHQP